MQGRVPAKNARAFSNGPSERAAGVAATTPAVLTLMGPGSLLRLNLLTLAGLLPRPSKPTHVCNDSSLLSLPGWAISPLFNLHDSIDGIELDLQFL
jgi:hypothetical protein